MLPTSNSRRHSLKVFPKLGSKLGVGALERRGVVMVAPDEICGSSGGQGYFLFA